MPKILKIAKLSRQINNKTLLTNGNFDVWQRGTSFDKTGYSADRWFFSVYADYDSDNTNRDGACIAQKVLSGGSIDNNSYAIELKNQISGNYYSLSQPIITENVLPHQGDTVTISYYARSADGSFSTSLSGCFFYSPNTDDIINGKEKISSSAFSHSVSSGSWTQHSHTFVIPSNAQTLLFEIIPVDTNLPINSKLQITQAKLELGAQSSPLIPDPVSDQIEECESYYQVINHASPIPQGNSRFEQTINLRSRLRLSENKTRINTQNIRNNSRNIEDQSFAIQDRYCISCQGSARVNNANLDVESITIESDIVPAAAPARPTNVVSSISNNALDIQWSGSANNGSYINYYAINYGTSSSNLDRSSVVDVSGNHPVGTPTSGTISGLIENQQYYFNITAYNAFGQTTSQTYSHFFDAYPNPSAVYNITGVYDGHTFASLNWRNIPGSPVPEKYIFQRDSSSSFNSSNLRSITVNNNANTSTRYLSNYDFDGQINNYNGVDAYYRIITMLGPESGVSDFVRLPRSLPSAPSNIITSAGVSSVVLNWIRPDTSNGSNISKYAIQYSTDSGNIANGTLVSINAQGSSNSTSISSLTPDTEVFFRIASVNAIGTGNWSNITSETPNRTPGTCSVPRELSASWADYQTFVDGDWGTSRALSTERVFSQSYTPPGSTTSYALPVSIARINWQPPADNGGQPISFYNVQLDTSTSYDSANYQTYNTSFWRQNGILLINYLVTDSASTWYYKCSAVTPSGTGLYASGTLDTAAPKCLLMSQNGQNNYYDSFDFVSYDTDVALNQQYYVNSCGLPLLSGYALTGTVSETPSSASAVVTFPRSDTSVNAFDLTISGLPQNSEFRYQPVWFNAAGSGSLNRPAGSVAWESGRTPVILSQAFQNVNLRLGSIQGNYTTTPRVEVRQSKQWTTSMGVPYVSGIYYSGIPDSGGVPIDTGVINLISPTTNSPFYSVNLPRANLPYVPYPTWLRLYTTLEVTGVNYVSTPQDFELWSSVSPPATPQLSIVSSNENGIITLNKTSYTTTTLGDSLANFSGSIYAEGYEGYAQSVNNSTQAIVSASGLFNSSNYSAGSHSLFFKASNSKFSSTSLPRSTLIQNPNASSKTLLFIPQGLIVSYPGLRRKGIYFSSQDYRRYGYERYYVDHLSNHFASYYTGALKDYIESRSTIGYVYTRGPGHMQFCLSDGNTTRAVHTARSNMWWDIMGELTINNDFDLNIEQCTVSIRDASDGHIHQSSSPENRYPIRLPEYDFIHPNYGSVKVYNVVMGVGVGNRDIGTAFIY